MTSVTRRAFAGSLAAGAAHLELAATAGDEWLDVAGGPLPEFCWRREGGILHAIVPCPAFHDLRSAVEFTDFEFNFEFRLAPGANSGVKYLLHKTDVWSKGDSAHTQARARGFEFQLIDPEAEDARKDPTHVTGALYGIMAPSSGAPGVADGKFHSALIRRRGPHIEHHVDGALLLSAEIDSARIQQICRERKIPAYSELAGRKSAVALQHHNSEVWFRNLRLSAI